MANTHNLIPVTKRTPKEQLKISRKGGKASAKAKKQRKTFQTLAQQILDMDAPDEIGEVEIKEFVKGFFPKINSKEITNRLVLFAIAMKSALNGNLRAFELLRDTAGEKPIEKIEAINKTETTVKVDKESCRNLADEIRKGFGISE